MVSIFSKTENLIVRVPIVGTPEMAWRQVGTTRDASTGFTFVVMKLIS